MPDLLSDLFDKPSQSRLPDLISFAKENKLTVGSTTGGRHNKGSRHYTGNAIDIKGSGAFDDATVQQLSRAASERGFLLRDERRRPKGQAVWGGPHIHIEYPRQREVQPQDPLTDLFDPKDLAQNPPTTTAPPKQRQPTAPKTIEEALQNIMRSTNQATAKLKRQAAKSPAQPQVTGSSGVGELRRIDDAEMAARNQQRKEIRDEQRGWVGSYGSPTPSGIAALFADPVGRFTGLLNTEEENIDREMLARDKATVAARQPEVTQIRQEYGQMSPAKRTAVAPLARGGAGFLKLAGGISSLAGLTPNQFSEWANKRADIVELSSQLPPLTNEQTLTSLITGNPELKEVERGRVEKVATAVADLGVQLGQIILLKKATGLPFNRLLALEAALKNNDKPLKEQAVKAAEGYAMGTILDQHLGRPVSAAVFGGPTGVQTGYEVSQGRMSPEDAVIQTGVQTVAGAVLGGKREIKSDRASNEGLVRTPRETEPTETRRGTEITREVDERPAFIRAGRQLGERDGQFVGNQEVTPAPNQRGVKTGYTRVLSHQDGGQRIVRNEQIVEKPVVSIKGVEELTREVAPQPVSQVDLPKARFIPNVGEVETSPNQQGVKRGYERVLINGAQRIVPQTSIAEGYKVRDAQLGETPYTVVRDFAGNESFLPQNVPHHSAFQKRAKTGEFKKGAVVPDLSVPEVKAEVLTRQTIEVPKTEAQLNPPASRAALQVRSSPEPARAPLTLVRNQTADRAFPKSAEAVGLPGGKNREYDPITNEQSLAAADAKIRRIGIDKAVSELAFKKEISAEDTATGIRLMQQLTQAGQVDRAADVAGDLAQKLTQAGQSVQAASIISRLSPEGVLLTAQRQLPEGKKLTKAQSESLVGQAKTVQEADTRIADLERQIAEMRLNVSQKKVTKPKLTEKIGTLEDRLVKLESEARARLEARKQQAQTELVGAKGQRGAAANPAGVALDLGDLAIVGAAKIARKSMSPAKWTAEMVSEFGAEIKPHLQKLYRDSYAIYDQNRRAMASESKERAVRRENIGPQRQEDLNRLMEQRTQAQKDSLAGRRELMRTFHDLSATPLQRVLSAGTGLRRANLLTAVKTHMRNIVSNTANLGTEELSRPMAALADVVMQRRTGLRTTTFADLPAVTRATYAAAIKEGPRRAADIMLGREVLPLEGYRAAAESLASKMQLNESSTGLKILDAYVKTVFRTLEAEDAVYKVYAFRRELADIAQAKAINEHATDKSISVRERAAELRANPTDAMLMQASAYADYATFQNKNKVSSAIAGFKHQVGSGGTFAIEQLAPFDRTPTNIIARTIENSPLGLFSAANKFRKIGSKAESERLAGRIADEAFTAAEQKEFVRTFGRASTGTILTALAVILAQKGLLTGASDYDTDKSDYMKKRREAGGGGMLRVPGTNQRISIVDVPAGKAMVTAAGIYEQMASKEKSVDERLSGSAKVLANTMILDQPLVRGLREIGQSKSVSEGIGNYGASYVPGSSALKSISETADPQARLVRGQGAGAPFKALTPMTRQSLPVDTAIDPHERGDLARRILRMIDPLNTTTEGHGPRKRKK